MATPFLGEIKPVAFNFAPRGWAQCNGQILAIQQNQALFSLLGTQYGGNGVTTFALPDLRSRIPVHVGSGFTQGQSGGAENVTLNVAQMPNHAHPAACHSTGGTTNSPVNAFWSTDLGTKSATYATSSDSTMATGAVGMTGGGQPHNNMPPYLAINFVIALQGIFPSRN